jgi:hypothetical protein
MGRLGNAEYGKIYKLVSFQSEYCYIGCTTARLLSERMAKHKCDYKRWLAGTQHYITSYELLKHDDCKIILLEKYPCKSRDELEARERYWLDNSINCINKQKPTRTQKEHYEENKEHFKQYKREWYLKRKDTHNQKSKERVICDCGANICRAALKGHLMTERHKVNLEKVKTED